jgi:hypothetical protein
MTTFGSLKKNYTNSSQFWATFFQKYLMYVLVLKTLSWATFWAIFTQIHLVTLLT